MASHPAELVHGPMVLGLLLSAILYGIMIFQVHIYFKAYSKSLSRLLFLGDTLSVIFPAIYLYDTTIRHFGDFDALGRANWIPALFGIIASTVQLFFAYRIWIITKTWYLPAVVIATSWAGGFSAIGIAVYIHFIPEFSHFHHFKRVVITCNAFNCVCDCLITSILVWQLYRNRKTGFQTSDAFLDRVIAATVQTGLLTATTAIAILALHLVLDIPLTTRPKFVNLPGENGSENGSNMVRDPKYEEHPAREVIVRDMDVESILRSQQRNASSSVTGESEAADE
ncbi:hypothetical protein C8J56DRAFT_953331, partial [Mycena floridula]